MTEIKFDPKKLDKLNSPERLKMINPDLVWETLNLKTPSVLVDIGAGTGIFAREFAKKIHEGKIYACDSSKIMVDWMKENLEDKNIIPILSDESFVGLDYGMADLVYMITVHHELFEPEKLLIEAHRLLKTGGKIAIIDWRKEEMANGPPVEKRISEETIINQLQKGGFNNIIKHNILPLHSFIIGQK